MKLTQNVVIAAVAVAASLPPVTVCRAVCFDSETLAGTVNAFVTASAATYNVADTDQADQSSLFILALLKELARRDVPELVPPASNPAAGVKFEPAVQLTQLEHSRAWEPFSLNNPGSLATFDALLGNSQKLANLGELIVAVHVPANGNRQIGLLVPYVPNASETAAKQRIRVACVVKTPAPPPAAPNTFNNALNPSATCDEAFPGAKGETMHFFRYRY
jgi:hypothetical protein